MAFLLQFQEYLDQQQEASSTVLSLGTQTCTKTKEESDQDDGTRIYHMFNDAEARSANDEYLNSQLLLGTQTITEAREESDQDESHYLYNCFNQ